MLCVAALSALVLQAAVLLLPLPASATALQPVIELAPSLKLTLPVGLLPATVAVKVTLAPDGRRIERARHASLSTVPDPSAAVPQASTSVMRE